MMPRVRHLRGLARRPSGPALLDAGAGAGPDAGPHSQAAATPRLRRRRCHRGAGDAPRAAEAPAHHLSQSRTQRRSRSWTACSSGSPPRTSARARRPQRHRGRGQPVIVPAIRQRVQDLRGPLDREEAARVARGRAQGWAARQSRAEGGGQGDRRRRRTGRSKRARTTTATTATGSTSSSRAPTPRTRPGRIWCASTAMTRMLTAVGTTPAVRELIQLYAHFGDLVRIDLQRQVAKLRDKAVPALIEARQHDAKIVQKWANKELDALGPRHPRRGGRVERHPDPRRRAPRLRANTGRRRRPRHPLVLQQRARAAPRRRARGARRHRRARHLADPRPVPRPDRREASARLDLGPPRARALRALRPAAPRGDPQADGRGRRRRERRQARRRPSTRSTRCWRARRSSSGAARWWPTYVERARAARGRPPRRRRSR